MSTPAARTNDAVGLLLTIDFEKACDSVSWSFILKGLDFFNFGPNIKRWVKTFYSIRTLVPVFQLMSNTRVGSIFIEGLGREIHVHRIRILSYMCRNIVIYARTEKV